MNNLTDLKNLLYNDLKTNSDRKEEMSRLQTNIVLYKDLIDMFNIDTIIDNLLSINIILDCLYDKKTIKAFKLEELVYGYIRNIDNDKEKYKNKIENIFNKIRLDASIEINKYDDIKSNLLPVTDVIMSKKIISSLKYNQVITEEGKEFINRRLEKEGIDFKNIIIILERINIHNKEVLKSEGEKIKYGELYSLINLLNQGYEYIELPRINNDSINDFCNNFIETIEKNSIDNMDILLNSLSCFNKDDLEYIYKKIMIYYQNKIYDTIESLKDEDCYFDNETIMIIKTEYYNLYNRYIKVRDHLDKLLELNKEELIEDIDKEDIKIKLYYSSNNYDDPSKCWFIKDLMDIREESLNHILDNINALKMNNRNRIKILKGKHGFSEIKDDQVRVIFKPVGIDKAIILGVFIKKDDNDREVYNKIMDRSLELCTDEYSLEVEKLYTDYIKENARKGSR